MPVLSRLHQNEIFALVQKQGLEPVDFELTTAVQSSRGDTLRFLHLPTQSRFEVSLSGENHWLTWWPKLGNRDTHFFTPSWGSVVQLVEIWAQEVKKSHDAPDLWAEARKAQQFANAVDEAQNTPFTKEELKQLGPKLDEVEAFIETRQPLTPEQKANVHSRFQYLLGAAKRGLGRIDWVNIFVSQVLALFVGGVLESSLYKEVMGHAWTALTGVLHLGAKMIEQHLKE